MSEDDNAWASFYAIVCHLIRTKMFTARPVENSFYYVFQFFKAAARKYNVFILAAPMDKSGSVPTTYCQTDLDLASTCVSFVSM